VIEKLQAHYGFHRMPFGRDLAPGMLHRHTSHNEAVARISWCISERSIGVVTGEVGAGKTVSVRTVLAGLDPSRHTVIYLPNPMIGVRGIHEEIVGAFGQAPSHLGSRLITQTGKALLAEREERGRTPVLVLDEAHLLTYEQLETIRMLTNQGMDQDSPLACLLVGQPTLRRTMKLSVLTALEQRTALRYTMPGMTATETTSYISHHIKLVGRPQPTIHRGRPRTHPHHRPRLPPRGQQPVPASPRRRVRRRQEPRRRTRRPRRRQRSRRLNTGTLPTTSDTAPTNAPPEHHRRGVPASPRRHPQRRLHRHLQCRTTHGPGAVRAGYRHPRCARPRSTPSPCSRGPLPGLAAAGATGR